MDKLSIALTVLVFAMALTTFQTNPIMTSSYNLNMPSSEVTSFAQRPLYEIGSPYPWIVVTLTNNTPLNMRLIIIASVQNQIGQTTGIFSDLLFLPAYGNETGYVAIPSTALPSGNYTANVFAISTNNSSFDVPMSTMLMTSFETS